MLTLGIDLASQPKKTAACLLEWGDGVRLVELGLGLDDEQLLALADRADHVGIDAPFGWPRTFSAYVAMQAMGTDEPLAWGDDELRRDLRLRRTDRYIWKQVTGRPPLSVSTDTIALPALRCTSLLRRLGVTDRSTGPVWETYPAAALARWIGISRGYKGADGVARRAAMAEQLNAQLPGCLPAVAIDDDDRFDAVVASLVARCAALGHTEPIPEADRAAARVEGWIVAPAEGSLAKLG